MVRVVGEADIEKSPGEFTRLASLGESHALPAALDVNVGRSAA
jgi:hypothetical protein